MSAPGPDIAATATFPLPKRWDRAAFDEIGFEGFISFAATKLARPPPRPGIYIVLRSSPDAPVITAETQIKRHAPFSVEELQACWVETATVVYVGKAKNLRKRLGQFRRKAANHAGGRAIWQLADQDELLVCWAETPGEAPADVETRFIAAFKAEHGRWPFANRRS